MLLVIIALLAWPILIFTAQLSVAAVVIGFGVLVALQIRSTELKTLGFKSGCNGSRADFYRQPTRAQRHAMRTSLKLALRQTELTSLFPAIAQRTQQFVRAEIR